MSIKSFNKEFQEPLIREILFVPSHEKRNANKERQTTLEIFKQQKPRKRFESVDNYSIIITNDFRQWIDDFQIDQISQGEPIDIELIAQRRKCSIIDNGENFVLFPGLEKGQQREMDFQANINEINIELNQDTDIQIELTFFDEKPQKEQQKQSASTLEKTNNGKAAKLKNIEEEQNLQKLNVDTLQIPSKEMPQGDVPVLNFQEQKLEAKIIKTKIYWEKQSFFIPNVFRMIKLIPKRENQIQEMQDLSHKEVLLQSFQQKITNFGHG